MPVNPQPPPFHSVDAAPLGTAGVLFRSKYKQTTIGLRFCPRDWRANRRYIVCNTGTIITGSFNVILRVYTWKFVSKSQSFIISKIQHREFLSYFSQIKYSLIIAQTNQYYNWLKLNKILENFDCNNFQLKWRILKFNCKITILLQNSQTCYTFNPINLIFNLNKKSIHKSNLNSFI